MGNVNVDEKLATKNRMLRTYPGKLLMGPVGNRLFADCLDRKPGFCGNIDFIHKLNLDMLFEICCSYPMNLKLAEAVWYPSHLKMCYEDDQVSFTETKHINANDIAFCCETWTNKGKEPMTLTLRVEPFGCQIQKKGSFTSFAVEQMIHNYRVGGCAGWQYETDSVTVEPGQTVTFLAAAAVGNLETETPESIEAKLRDFFRKDQSPRAYAEESIADYQSFFDKVPAFSSSDPMLDKTWWYRWYILRNATSRPEFGYLTYPTVYEGRAHKTSKLAPLQVLGWEFSRLINLSSPLQMTDYRWYPDKELLHDFVRGYLSVTDDNGIIQSAFTDHKGGGFANFLIWAIYRIYLLDGDKEFLKEILPKAKACVDGNTKMYGAKNDLLQIEVKHARTGKECQPSFWYFSQFPGNHKDRSKITPLKRLDTSVYHYLNMKGLGLMMEEVGDPEAESYLKAAETLASQINEKTWDQETQFYYDLHYETDEKAMVKNIVGIYPYWAEIAGKEKLAGLEKLFSPDYFNTGAVFSSVAKDCPAYTAHGGWMGVMRGRDSCMWDGPSWPYTNGIALDAIGRQSKKNGHCYDGRFREFLEKYEYEHYRNGNVEEPYLVEQYHAVTGENLSDEPDYNHSFFLDLIISHVAGVDVQKDRIVIDPLDVGLRYFKLENLMIRGSVYEIALDEAGVFTVRKDGELVSSRKGLGKIELPL